MTGQFHCDARLRRNLLLTSFLTLTLMACFCQRAAAQTDKTQKEFWPEVDVYVKINEKLRLLFVADSSRDGESKRGLEAHVGVNLDYRLNEKWSFRAGYKYGFSLDNDDDYQENRILLEQTLRVPLPAGLLLSDRNREDFRFLSGDFSVRYRNRVMLEREFAIRRFKFTPYASGEIYYDTRFDAFNRNRTIVGVQLPLGVGLAPLREHLALPRRKLSLDLYYARQNDSRSEPNHVNALGALLTFSF